MTSTNIFIDTSWYKALVDAHDDFHNRALSQYKTLRSEENIFITTNFIIDETLTLFRVRRDLEIALKFRDLLVDISVITKIIRVLPQDESMAWHWFPKPWSKLSFTDCTSFAVMQRLNLKDVATFDDHFARAGFNMLS
jgi:Predicted nucleic acid-binding protein, contains PIN domain